MAKDRFTIPLECPNCGLTGEAHCEQEDGWAFVKGKASTTLKNVTEGFTRVYEKSGWGDDINFVCEECDVICLN